MPSVTSIILRKSIVLSHGNIEAKQTKTNEGRFIFVEQGIGKVYQKITFQIINMKNWIGLGIALREKITSKNYKF